MFVNIEPMRGKRLCSGWVVAGQKDKLLLFVKVNVYRDQLGAKTAFCDISTIQYKLKHKNKQSTCFIFLTFKIQQSQ